MVSFKKMAELEPNSVMVVDALNLAFRYKHNKSVHFVQDYINTVRSLQQSYKCEKVIIACDKGSSAYRKGLYPEYKMNRKDKQDLQTPEEELEFKAFFEEFNRTMEAIEEFFPVLRFDKVEADDIAALIVSNMKALGLEHIWLISSDRDWDLLVKENVSRWSYVTRKETTVDNWDSHYLCTPEEYISMKCLEGDAGDNVKGVDGIGPKRAIALIRQYGSAFDIVDAIPITSKYKYIQSLNQCADLILLNYKLMDLLTYCEEAIGKENCDTIMTKLEKYLND